MCLYGILFVVLACLASFSSPHLSLNLEGHWSTTDDFTTNVLHFSLFSTVPWDMANSRPVHCLMLSSHLLLCLPGLLPPFTVPCKMVLVRPDKRETCPYRSILALTFLLVTCLTSNLLCHGNEL